MLALYWTKELDLTINSIDLNMGDPLLTWAKYSSEDVLPVNDLTENEGEEEIEIDTLIVDGETVSQDVSSNNNSWILYINTIPFLKVRRERHDKPHWWISRSKSGDKIFLRSRTKPVIDLILVM